MKREHHSSIIHEYRNDGKPSRFQTEIKEKKSSLMKMQTETYLQSESMALSQREGKLETQEFSSQPGLFLSSSRIKAMLGFLLPFNRVSLRPRGGGFISQNCKRSRNQPGQGWKMTSNLILKYSHDIAGTDGVCGIDSPQAR